MAPPSKKARMTALKKANTKYVAKLKRTTAPTAVRIGKQPFPKQLYNTLKYVDNGFMAITTGLGQILFRANGMVSPRVAAGGHKPLYFNQLGEVYNHYTVLRSRIKITIAPSLNVAHTISMYLDDDTGTKATPIEAAEMPGATTRLIVPPSGQTYPLYHSFDAAKIFGGNVQSQDSLQASITTNPTEASFFVFSVLDHSGTNQQILYICEMEFDIVWDEFKTITPS